jgi:hypothetical protein
MGARTLRSCRHVARVFDRLFFPRDDQFAAKTPNFAMLAAGFLVRPLDGLVIGLFKNSVGRKSVLLCLLMMVRRATTVRYVGWPWRKNLATLERLTEIPVDWVGEFRRCDRKSAELQFCRAALSLRTCFRADEWTVL